MNTIPAKEIKRRGISAVDELLERGPVHVIQYDEPRYVIMTEQRFQSLLEAERIAEWATLRESIDDVRLGRVSRYDDVEDLIHDLDGTADTEG